MTNSTLFNNAAEMFSYVAALKKLDHIQPEIMTDMLKTVKEHFAKDNPEAFAEYTSRHGMTESQSDIGDFNEWTVVTDHGGRIKIVDFGDKQGDMGMMSTMNGYGMGGSQYIRAKEGAGKHIESINRNTWLNEDEKTFLIAALEKVGTGIR